MPLTQFVGTWLFDPATSDLTFPEPRRWLQHVTVEQSRLKVREEITRGETCSKVVVDAVPDGTFYPVTGLALADEIAYTLAEKTIYGTGRKSGAVSFTEVITLDNPNTLRLQLYLALPSGPIPIGTARFTRQSITTPE